MALSNEEKEKIETSVKKEKENSETFDKLVEDFIIELIQDNAVEKRKTIKQKLDEVLTAASIDRKLYCNLRSSGRYSPRTKLYTYYYSTRNVLFRLGFVLQLSLAGFSRLLESKGFAFCRNCERDVILLSCVKEKIYDLAKIDEYLAEKNLETLSYHRNLRGGTGAKAPRG